MLKVRVFLRPLVVVSALLFVTGCNPEHFGEVTDKLDPLNLPYHWRPMGINQLNLEAQVERKSDLISGRPRYSEDGHHAAEAVQRWRDDNLRPLQSLQYAAGTGGGQNTQAQKSAYKDMMAALPRS